jgi:hypothetical protein
MCYRGSVPDDLKSNSTFSEISFPSKATKDPFGALKAPRNVLQVLAISGTPRAVTLRL